MKYLPRLIFVLFLAVGGCSQGVKPETKPTYTFTFKNEWINDNLTNRLKGVYIGASFNGFKYKSSPLTYSNGIWTTNISLAPGKYTYKYVCVFDGMWEDQWIHDFGNPNVRINEFYSYNSVLKIAPDGTVPPVKIYDENDSEHFRFFYKANDFKTNSIDDYVNESEKNARKLASFLHVKFPERKITVYLESSWKSSWDLNAFVSIILYGVPQNQQVFIHELTHILVYSYSNLAMSEGLAQYCGDVLYPYDKAGVFSAIPFSLYPIALFKNGNTNTVAYYMSHPKEFWWTENPSTIASYNFMASFTEYLAKKNGIDSVVRLFENGFDFQEVYKKSVVELDKEWKASLLTKKLSEDEKLIVDYLSTDLGFLSRFFQMNNRNKETLRNKLKNISYPYPDSFYKLIVNKNNIVTITDKKMFKEQLEQLKTVIAELLQE